jgi:hypothetical protein
MNRSCRPRAARVSFETPAVRRRCNFRRARATDPLHLTNQPLLRRLIMRFVILGNSGAGKTMLARAMAARSRLPVLQLDSLPADTGAADNGRLPDRALALLEAFCACDEWIVEGRDGTRVLAVLPHRPELVFLNPGPAVCMQHCRSAAWEPHRYASSQAQRDHLPQRLQAVADYYRGDGADSLRGHRAIFDGYGGPKRELQQPVRLRIADEIWLPRPVTGS